MPQNIDLFALEIRSYLAEITGKPYKFICQQTGLKTYQVSFRASEPNPSFEALITDTTDPKKESKDCKNRFLKYLQEIRPEILTDKYKN